MTDWPLPETCTFRDQTVRFNVTGTGPPLVLVHGTPFSSYVWHRIAPHLAQIRTVHYYDLLGYGQSEMRDGQDVVAWRPERLARRVARALAIEEPGCDRA